MCIHCKYNFAPFLTDGEEIKEIELFPEYYVTNYGNVFSVKRGFVYKLKPYLDSKKRYLLLHLCTDKVHSVLLHRLVAKAFIPNPNNLPEINHKDRNTQNPRADNLEWCTRKENLMESYQTMSPIRNFNSCLLYKNSQLLGEFKSVSDACRYAKENYGVSYSSLEKYLRYGDYYLKTSKIHRKTIYDGKIHTVQNRTPIKLFYRNEYVEIFKSFREVKEYIAKIEGHCCSETTLNKVQKYKEYTMIRDS